MSTVSTIAGVTNQVMVGGSVLSLLASTKALVQPSIFKPGVEGRVFDMPETHQISLKANITEHFVEDNSVMQDHIAISPRTITLSGKVAEVALIQSQYQKYAATVLARLTSLGVLKGQMSITAQELLSQFAQAQQLVDNIVGSATDIAAIIQDGNVKTKQQKFFQDFQGMFYRRALVSVETPWQTFEQMAIESITFDQDESTQDWSTVTITLKEMNFANTKTITGKIPQGRAASQQSSVAEQGKAVGNTASASVLKQLLTFFGK